MFRPLRLALAAAFVLPSARAEDAETPQRSAGIVEITGQRVSSLPTYLPTTIETVTGEQIETRINASDAEDALKYLPSLLVRKRYIGDYNHAVLSSRASGTGNSARSMVYADGILLSNYLGNGAAFAPRWGLVTPEEIERVDVLYGPFSAAYPGNSVGAVVDYQTRLPSRFEAHAKAGFFVQPFDLYATHETYDGWQASASIGDRAGAFSWWLDVSRLDSEGQPLTFTSQATPAAGAVPAPDRFGNTVYITGAGTVYRTVQDQAKAKLAWSITPALRALLLLGTWRNRSEAEAENYLTGTRSASGRDDLRHHMQGLTLQSRDGDVFDWTLAASRYDYGRDLARVPGRVTDLSGTGWTTLAAKGLWRPDGAHRVDLGAQQERYQWRQRIDGDAAPISAHRGNTQLRSLYAQDRWALGDDWTAVFGVRYERWTAWGGEKSIDVQAPVPFQERHDSWLSPKLAFGWQLADDWALKLSSGRAVRVPTVGELFQGNAGGDQATDPDLKPEKSWTRELSAEWARGGRRARMTLFHENTTDALYAQPIAGTNPIANSVQNIARIRTVGVETAFEATDLVQRGFDLQGSLTYTDSKILENDGYVATPGDTVGKQQPRVPKWRASLLASWRFASDWTASYGLRYGSRQYGTLNNSDPNGFAYQGFSKYFTTDARLHWKIDKQWRFALGIDNLNNDEYWNFHPYPQRTYSAELRFDL